MERDVFTSFAQNILLLLTGHASNYEMEMSNEEKSKCIFSDERTSYRE